MVAFHPILYIIFQKSKKFRCMWKFSEFRAFGVILSCRLTDHSEFYAVREYNFYVFSYRHSQFWICSLIIIDWLMNWLLRQWDFTISISLEMILGLFFRSRFRGLYFSVQEIFLFQLYHFINYYFRALSFRFLIHR